MQGWSPKHKEWESPAVEWRYLELDAAQGWGMTPWEFDARPNGEKAEMLAFVQVKRTLEAWEYEQAEKAAERRR